MTDAEFSERLTAMRETLYRVSYSRLSQGCDRDDAVQETLLKAWDNRHRLNEERYMQTWVVRILINECGNIHRRRRRETPLGDVPADSRTAPPDSDIELHDALFRLREPLRLPIVLHYIEGFRVREIADMLRMPQGTVLWRLSKARKELSKLLDEGEIRSSCVKTV